MIRLFLIALFLVGSVGIYSASASAVADDEFRLLKVNTAKFYGLCPEILIAQERECLPESYELRDDDEKHLLYEDFVVKRRGSIEESERGHDASFECSIHGTYLTYKGDIKIGMIRLSNAAGAAHEENANAYGFTSGEYVERTVFWMRGM